MAVLKREEYSPAQTPNQGDVHTILGPESSFEGKLVFEGTVRVDGKFKGSIETEHTLVIGQTAHVDGEVHAGHVIINGDVHGEVHAKKLVEIHAPGKMRGNLHTPELMIDKGVLFEGSCHMEEVMTHQNHAKVTLLSTVEPSALS